MAKRAKNISLQGRKGAAARAKRSRSEYAADQRERDAFLDRMKITDPAMREIYGRPVDFVVRDRLLERLESSLGTAPDHTEIELSGVDPDLEESTIGEHRDDLSVSSCYPDPDVGVGDQNLSGSAGDCSEQAHQPIQDAPQKSDEEAINLMVDSCLAGVNLPEPRPGGEAHPEMEPVAIVSLKERADDETAPSGLRDDAVACSATPPLPGTIAGDLETVGEAPRQLPEDKSALGPLPADDAVGFPEKERATWFESDFAPGSVSPWRPAILARIDEREPASDHLKMIVEGGLADADIWLKPDLAESGLRLVQRTGRSSLLPPYNAVFLPPKLTMLGLAGTVSIDPAESNRFDCWDRQTIQNNTFGEFGQGAIASSDEVENMVRKAIAKSIETERIFTPNILIDERQLAMMTRYWILLLLALNRPNLISVFGMSYFLGVHGHDPGLGDEGYFEIIYDRWSRQTSR